MADLKKQNKKQSKKKNKKKKALFTEEVDLTENLNSASARRK